MTLSPILPRMDRMLGGEVEGMVRGQREGRTNSWSAGLPDAHWRCVNALRTSDHNEGGGRHAAASQYHDGR